MPMKHFGLDEKITEVAEAMFLEKGLFKVEMKDIAKSVGVSRSTLYRHYESILEIAFSIARKIGVELCDIDVNYPENSSGYEKLCLFIEEFIENLARNGKKLMFLCEFDIMYSSTETVSPRAKAYDEFFRQFRTPIQDLYLSGIEDGSIYRDKDSELTSLTILNTCFALAQRILIREGVYLRVYDVGQRMVKRSMRIMLYAIDARNHK